MLQTLLSSAPGLRRRFAAMSPALRTGFIVSVALHLAVLLFLLIGMPRLTPDAEPPEETTVSMMFEGDAKASMRAPNPADVPAPSKEAAPPAPPVKEPPKPQPVEAPPPPPPPPPPPQTHVEPALPTPPPPVPTPPPEPSPEPAPVVPPPPPTPPTPPTPAPPKPEPPLPLPPPPVPPPAPPSTTSQPNVTKNAVANSDSVDNTLERLRALQKQTQPPKAKSNPVAGGAPNSGGNPNGNDTAALTSSQRGAIGDHVRECWTKDAGALDIDKQRVMLTVTTDATGMARKAEVAGDDIGRMSDPRFRAFAERALRAILDARCANLPLPSTALGKVNVLTFRFTP